MVRTVDSGGVVYKVGVAHATQATKFDTAELGNSEIATLAQYPGAQFVAVDPKGIIGLIANRIVTLGTSFYVGTNA